MSRNIDVKKLMNSEITNRTVPTPIDTIITRLESGFYYIPPYQRKYIWSEKQVVDLVISLLRDIPIPKLYMYNNYKDGRYTIIDGQQRLTSLFFFVKGVFPDGKNRKSRYDFKDISELVEKYYKEDCIEIKEKIKKELKEKYSLIIKNFVYINNDGKIEGNLNYRDFSDDEKLEFNNKTFEFGVISIKDPTKNKVEEVYGEVFRLLNSAGSLLSKQEIRNGLYYNTALYKGM